MSRSGNERKEQKARMEQLRSNTQARARKLMLAAVLAAAILGVATAAYFLSKDNSVPSGPAPAAPVGNQTNDTVVISTSEVGPSARYYTYDSNGVTVRFFLVKGSDGNIHIAADACDVCYPLKKGYRQTGDLMTCNNCGMTYPINSLGKDNTAGGCWPSHISMKLDGASVIVRKTDLDAKRYLFE